MLTNNRSLIDSRFHRDKKKVLFSGKVAKYWATLTTIPLLVALCHISKQQADYTQSLLDNVIEVNRDNNIIMSMEEWRESLKNSCQEVFDTIKVEKLKENEAWKRKKNIEDIALSAMDLPKKDIIQHSRLSQHETHHYCKNTFIDLGSNIGDSIGRFVDSTVDICTPMWKEAIPRTRANKKNFPCLHLDVTDEEDINFSTEGSCGHPITVSLKHYLDNHTILPEDVCVYGMEGNPRFTKRLKRLESYVLGMRPRPMKHLHFHTESVISATDGPTKLYLDQTSVAENFWGSSILSSQQDAQKTAEQNNGTLVSTEVEGIRLSSLIQRTTLPFKPGATNDDKSGGMLIVKMDVEGAEYQVMKEIADSGVLCDYVALGNKVVMIVEFHRMSITDATERRSEMSGSQKAIDELKKCGVEFGKLSGGWH